MKSQVAMSVSIETGKRLASLSAATGMTKTRIVELAVSHFESLSAIDRAALNTKYPKPPRKSATAA